jgi:rhodanese-related sulfurtransferase
MKHISVDAFKEVVEAEANNTSIAFLNVCTPAEYKEKHIPGVQNIPLSDLGKAVTSLRDKKTIYVHCRSGNRGRQAIESLTQLGLTAELVNVEGGLLAWDAAGYTTASLTNRMPIMRQVLIAAGSFVLLGYLLSIFVSPLFIYLSVFVGAGLVFAGVSGWCGMSYVLAKMPWNK